MGLAKYDFCKKNSDFLCLIYIKAAKKLGFLKEEEKEKKTPLSLL